MAAILVGLDRRRRSGATVDEKWARLVKERGIKLQ
jgi:hypothetical protein